MDEQLRTKEFLDLLHHHLPVMIMVRDGDGELRFINGELSRRSGHTLDQMRELPDPLASFLPNPALREEFRRFLEQAPPGRWIDVHTSTEEPGTRLTFWTCMRMPDGGTLALGLDAAEQDREDHPDIPFHRDFARRIPQLRNLVMELSLAEQQERNRLSRILHDDLQQILVCANYSLTLLKGRLLKDETGLALAEEVGRIVTKAVAASRTLSYDLNPPILFQGGLRDILEWLASAAGKNFGIDISFGETGTTDPVEPPEAIRFMLYQMVRELLRNALRHAEARRIDLTLVWREKSIEIAVEDDGAGFDPSLLDTRGGASAGIGLNAIRERLDLMGGALTIEAKPGKGSRFILRVPAAADGICKAIPKTAPELAAVRTTLAHKKPPPTRPPHGEQKRGRITVVLADDHRMVRKGLVALLSEQADIQVIAEAGDGEKAVELARELRPEVIVMDVEMPRMDGIEATRRIRSFLPDVKIIGLSMIEEPDIAARMVSAGATCYLSKSGPTDFLLKAIREEYPCRDKAVLPDLRDRESR